MEPASGDSAGTDLDRLRAGVVAAGRRLGARGLVSAGEGNLSVRLPDGRLLVTPSSVRKDELQPDDLLIVAAEGEALAASPSMAAARRPTSDLAIHRAIYARRPDVSAVVHAHPPAALALTLAGERPDPEDLPETALLLPRLPFVAHGTPGSGELAARLAEAIAGGPRLPGAVLLERHGAFAVGDGDPVAALMLAVDRMELIEVLCRASGDALRLRAARAVIGPGQDDRPSS